MDSQEQLTNYLSFVVGIFTVFLCLAVPMILLNSSDSPRYDKLRKLSSKEIKPSGKSHLL